MNTPEGYILDEPMKADAGIASLPDGFVMDDPVSSDVPDGFVLDSPPASASSTDASLSATVSPPGVLNFRDATDPASVAFKQKLQADAAAKAEKESALVAGGREAAFGVAPTLAGIAGGVGAGALAGTLGAGPVGTVVGGLVGGIGAAMGADWVQGKAIDAIDPVQAATWQAEREAAAQAHPVATAVGSLAPALIAMKPSPANVAGAFKAIKAITTGALDVASPAGKVAIDQLFNVGIGAAVPGAQEAYAQYQAGDFNGARLAAQIIGGALINEPNRFGVKMGLHPTTGEAEVVADAPASESPAVVARETTPLPKESTIAPEQASTVTPVAVASPEPISRPPVAESTPILEKDKGISSAEGGNILPIEQKPVEQSPARPAVLTAEEQAGIGKAADFMAGVDADKAALEPPARQKYVKPSTPVAKMSVKALRDELASHGIETTTRTKVFELRNMTDENRTELMRKERVFQAAEDKAKPVVSERPVDVKPKQDPAVQKAYEDRQRFFEQKKQEHIEQGKYLDEGTTVVDQHGDTLEVITPRFPTNDKDLSSPHLDYDLRNAKGDVVTRSSKDLTTGNEAVEDVPFRTGDAIAKEDPKEANRARFLVTKVLGKNAPVEVVDRIFERGAERLGKYEKGLITIAAKGDMDRTAYHEALHGAEDMLMTPKELDAMKAIEPDAEKRADSFMEYAAKNGEGFGGKIRQYFDRLNYRIRKLFGAARGIDELKAMHARLVGGKMAGREAKAGEGAAKYQRQKAVTPEVDKAYMDAVERGDTAEAQRMVDEAAKKIGFTIKAFHGTMTEKEFTTFDKGKIGTGHKQGGRREAIDGIYFSNSSENANYYSGGWKSGTEIPVATTGKDGVLREYNKKSIVMPASLRMDNPLVIDALNLPKDYAGNGGWNDLDKYVRSKLGKGVHDGVIYKNTKDPETGDTFVVFDPSQIKSADPITRDDQGRVIPLSERFNPDTADIRYRTLLKPDTADPDLVAGIDRQNKMFDDLKAAQRPSRPLMRRIRDVVGVHTVNQQAPIDTRALELGRKIERDAGVSPRKEGNMGERFIIAEKSVKHMAAQAAKRFADFSDKIKSMGLKSEQDLDEFGAYMNAKRTVELGDVRDGEAFDSPLTIPQAEKIVEMYETRHAKKAAFKAASIEAQKEFRKSLDLLLEAGTISQKSYDSVKDKFYMPRWFIDKIDPVVGQQAGKLGEVSVRQSGIRYLKSGSKESMVLDPLTLMAHNIISAESIAARNKSMRRLADLADVATDTQKKLTDFDIHSIPLDKVPRDGYERVDYWVDGEKKSMEVQRDLAEALTYSQGIDPTTAAILRVGSGTSFVKFMATAGNWEFSLGNVPRDWGLQYLAGDSWSSFVPKALAQQLKQAGSVLMDKNLKKILRDNYYKFGGETDWLSSSALLNASSMDPKLRAGKSATQKAMWALSVVGNKSEELSRLMNVNQELKNMGVSAKTATPDQWAMAVHKARSILDFSENGKTVKFLDNMIPFLNPAFQGVRSILRAFKDRPVQTNLKAAQLVAGATALYYMARKNNPEAMDSISEGDMTSKLNIPLGVTSEKNGEKQYGYVGIPIDQAWRPFIVLGKLLADKAHGLDVDPTILRRTIFANYVPADVNNFPPILAAIQAYSNNYDFWKGDKIWRGRSVSPEAEKTSRTPDRYVKAGEMLGMSPERLRVAESKILPNNPLTWARDKAFDMLSDDARKDLHKDQWQALAEYPGSRKYIRMTSPRSLSNDDLKAAKRLGVKVKDKASAAVLNDIDKREKEVNTVRQNNDVFMQKLVSEVKNGKKDKAEIYKAAWKLTDEKGKRGKERGRALRALKARYPDMRIIAPSES